MSDPLSNSDAEELLFSSDLPMTPADLAPPDLEEVPHAFDQGRYIALVDLNQFLGNNNVDNLLPTAEVVLGHPLRPLNVGSSMVELPSSSREDTFSPAPLPRLMKNLIKNRRRLQRQLVEPAVNPSPDVVDMEKELKKLDNYQLPLLLAEEAKKEPPFRPEIALFARDLMISTIHMGK